MVTAPSNFQDKEAVGLTPIGIQTPGALCNSFGGIQHREAVGLTSGDIWAPGILGIVSTSLVGATPGAAPAADMWPGADMPI